MSKPTLRQWLLPLALAAIIVPASAQSAGGDDLQWRIEQMIAQQPSVDTFRAAQEMAQQPLFAKTERLPAAYEYVYSPERSARNVAQYIQTLLDEAQRSGHLTPESEQNIREMASWKVTETMRERIAAHGANPDSIAQAMALWLQINHMTIHEAQGQESSSSILLHQLETALSQDESLIRADDAEKQQIAEQFLWMAFLQILVREDAAGDAAKMRLAAEQAERNLRSMDIDPAALHIDDGVLKIR